MSRDMIEIENLERTFISRRESVRALKGITLTVPDQKMSECPTPAWRARRSNRSSSSRTRGRKVAARNQAWMSSPALTCKWRPTRC
jgi:hypothetical protein